jgi:hypothetical protein
MALKIGEAVQQLLTQGLDAAAQVKLAELRVNDPTGYVTGPNGQRVQVGQSAGGALASVPPVVWLGLVAIVGVVVILPLLRR